MWTWALDYLACPECREALSVIQLSPDERSGVIGHVGGDCHEVYPVIDGVPRILLGESRTLVYARKRGWFGSTLAETFAHWAPRSSMETADLRIVRRFDEEWSRFAGVGSEEQNRLFDDYFDVVPPGLLAPGILTLDAGCGAGRWANEIQRHGNRVIAVDLGFSIELAERNTRDTGRVACVQGDVRRVPIRNGAIAFTYSLGVLHHIADTEAALTELARVTQPNGTCLVYLYYALDDRSPLYRGLFRLVDALRRFSSRLPQPLLVGFSTLTAALVYWPFARAAAALERMGLSSIARALPLSFYAHLSFETMRNDSLDRFGTQLEKRYTLARVEELMTRAGFAEARASRRMPKWRVAARKL